MFFDLLIEKDRKTRGRKKVYSDSLILSLAVLRNLLGYDTESHFIWEINLHWRGIFPSVPSKSLFNRRFRKLNKDFLIIKFFGKIQKFYKELLDSDIRLIDSQPVIFKKAVRKNSKNTRVTEMDLGYCSSLKEYYFGYKLHFITTEQGFPSRFMLSPASVHDNSIVMDFTYGLEDIKLVGDKGYIGQKDKERLKSLRNIDKITPYRSNMKLKLNEAEKELLSHRHGIEKDFSTFEVLNIKYCRAKSTSGTLARVMTGILTLMLIMISNWELENNVSVAFCSHFT